MEISFNILPDEFLNEYFESILTEVDNCIENILSDFNLEQSEQEKITSDKKLIFDLIDSFRKECERNYLKNKTQFLSDFNARKVITNEIRDRLFMGTTILFWKNNYFNEETLIFGKLIILNFIFDQNIFLNFQQHADSVDFFNIASLNVCEISNKVLVYFNFIKYLHGILNKESNNVILNIDVRKLINEQGSMNLNYNGIQVIQENIFIAYENLKSVLLANNNLSILDKDVFVGLKNLNVLDLNNNRISKIDRNAFKDLPNLEILNLNSNLLKQLVRNGFGELKNLLELDLSNNKIKELSENCFSGLLKLKSLNLSSNRISRIENEAFLDIKSLIHLNLKHNQIESFPLQLLDELKNLEFLDLSKNKLDSKLKEYFSSYNNIQI